MELSDIHYPSDVRNNENSDIISMHHRCHQLYTLALKHNNKEFEKRIIMWHKILSDEMIRRGFNHQSPLPPKVKPQWKHESIELYLEYITKKDK